MNFLQIQKNNHLLRNLINPISRVGNKMGLLNVVSTNSLEHERIKFLIFNKLKRQGYELWSECIFTNGKRADIVAIDPKTGEGNIIEILHTETEEMFNNKVNSYPIEFDLVQVKTKDFDINSFEL